MRITETTQSLLRGRGKIRSQPNEFVKEFKRDVNTRLTPGKSDTIAKNKVKMPKRISNDCTNHFELNIKVHAVHMHHFVGGNHFG